MHKAIDDKDLTSYIMAHLSLEARGHFNPRVPLETGTGYNMKASKGLYRQTALGLKSGSITYQLCDHEKEAGPS